jgi:hypothetical protein
MSNQVFPEPEYDLVLAASKAKIKLDVTIEGECESPIIFKVLRS